MNPIPADRFLAAQELAGRHIGSVVEFEWEFPRSGVRATVTGRLSQVRHDGVATFLHLTAPDDAAASGARDEFVLDPMTTVEVK